jgi:hypothetical protein
MTACESCEQPCTKRTRCSHCAKLLCAWCYDHHKNFRSHKERRHV